MNKPELTEKSGFVMESALGFREPALLLTAVKLDLFERIGRDKKSPGTISQGEDPEGLSRLCRALAALNLLEQQDHQFCNTPAIEQLLTSRGEVDLRPILNHYVELYEMWGDLDEALLTGQSYQFDLGGDDQFSERFTEAMEARARLVREELVHAIGDRLNGGRLLDLGGGSGVFARALLKHDSEASGVVADRPAPLSVAEEYIERNSLWDRLRIRTLDLLEDEDYGTDFDLVLISSVLHVFGPEDARTVLDRAHSALAPGGQIVVRDHIVHNDRSGPLDSLLFDVLMYLATEDGRTYTEKGFREMFEEAGLVNVERVRLPQSTDDLLIGWAS